MPDEAVETSSQAIAAINNFGINPELKKRAVNVFKMANRRHDVQTSYTKAIEFINRFQRLGQKGY